MRNVLYRYKKVCGSEISPLVEDLFLTTIDDQVYSVTEMVAMIEVLKEQDVPAEAILAGTSISPEMLEDTNTRASIRQRIKVYKNIQQFSKDPAAVLRGGMRMHVTAYGIWGYAVLSSATLADAIKLAFKYLRLAGPLMRKSFDIDDRGAYFEAEDVLSLGPILPSAIEFWFASVKAMLEDLIRSELQAPGDQCDLSGPGIP